MANKTKFNLSFAGCGFLGIYHVGVAACLKKYAPQLVVHKASGASAGAIAACCLLCDAPLGKRITICIDNSFEELAKFNGIEQLHCITPLLSAPSSNYKVYLC